jgi:pyroglutamyl-peptidase
MLLLTAFEPFDQTGINSSLEALHTWQQRYGTAEVRAAILPVRYDADVETLDKVLCERTPQVILHLGQTTRGWIDVERLAVNLKLLGFETSPDEPLQHQLILPGAPPAYEATVPVETLVRRMAAAGLPARDSAHAGTYLCNHVLYRSLHRVATQHLNTRVGFLHLPRLPQQAALLPEPIPTLPIENLVAAITIAVDTLREAC